MKVINKSSYRSCQGLNKASFIVCGEGEYFLSGGLMRFTKVYSICFCLAVIMKEDLVGPIVPSNSIVGANACKWITSITGPTLSVIQFLTLLNNFPFGSLCLHCYWHYKEHLPYDQFRRRNPSEITFLARLSLPSSIPRLQLPRPIHSEPIELMAKAPMEICNLHRFPSPSRIPRSTNLHPRHS